LYLKMKMLWNILNSREVYGLRDAYTPLKCRQYVWAVYDDMRSFFAQRMQPSDFQKHTPAYPTSLLDSMFEQARFALEVNRVNFPVAWLEKKPEPTNRQSIHRQLRIPRQWTNVFSITVRCGTGK
jgi:hypothetical protein